MITPDPSSWTVAITHPDTGRVRTPDVLDRQPAPVINPGPNAQPTVRIPVRTADVWLSEAYNDDPEMRVWRDGERLPIEVLRDVQQEADATILVGVGGVGLEGRVQAEFDDDRRHEAVRDLVSDATGYGVDAPEPDVTTRENELQQEATTTAEFDAVKNRAETDRVNTGTDSYDLLESMHHRDGYDGRADSGGGSLAEESDYSGAGTGEGDGTAYALSASGDFAEYEYTTAYTIPEAEVGVHLRRAAKDGDNPEFDVFLNGTRVDTFPEGTLPEGAGWRDHAQDPGDQGAGWDAGDLQAGTHTIRVEATTTPAGEIDIDRACLGDNRPTYNFDNSPTWTGTHNALDGPERFRPATALFEAAATPFDYVAGRATVTMPDMSGAQFVQISNDGGGTWLPDDGTEQNTTSVDVDPFPDSGASLVLRVGLSDHEPSGLADTTPREGYAGQSLESFELRADIAQELLLIAETFDNDLASVLTSIAEPAERSWAVRTDADGNLEVRFVQNGQFTADFTPEFSDRTREKLGKTYESVTIKGSNEPVSNEPYTASTTFTALVRDNILPGSETVYDDTQNYARGDDYEMRYSDGEIRATDGGDLTPGTDYRIDYRYQARGTYAQPSAPADPDEFVETVPGVTSARLGEQVAFVIAEDVDTPRYAAEVTIPDPDPRFDPTEALPPAALGLPASVSPLEVRGSPELTERGLRVRLGTRPAVESTQQRLARQLSRVSDRS